ncbi:type VI secretion system protein TssL, long form [Paraburkholderia aspalathi]|uniref:type VI secretion system protein TssL, long form n=1 Tax=Paraburkholderia aspalathi TaxID=1324617 RepID=UPI0038B6C9EB
MSAGIADDHAFDFLTDAAPTGGDPDGLSLSGSSVPEENGAFNDSVDPAVAGLQHRLADMEVAANPLLEAAQPLLRMLADMPVSLDRPDAVAALRALLVREVTVFQRLCDKADLPWKHMAVVRYCLCTALDEAANRTTWGSGLWAAQSLLVTFEGESDGGEKFFLLIGRMATDPQEYAGVLEVLYRILGLGFEGRYSVVIDGRRHLEQIRQRLWTLIAGTRDGLQPELSPHWRGVQSGKLNLLRHVPVWASFAISAMILFGVFIWFQYNLLPVRNNLDARILALGKLAPVPEVRRLRLTFLLRNEIARGLLTVTEDDRHGEVVFRGDNMFMSARSQVQPDMLPVLDKVGLEVARVGGHVSVIGHTDSQPIRSAEYPDNVALSERRAQYVAQILQARGTPASRIRAIGKGDEQPVAENTTASGRARNRRVVIDVTL